MAQRPSVVASEATAIPEPADIERVAAFVHEPFVSEDESPEDVLAPGTVRRHAFEFARAELDAGATVPSQKWRRRWSLLLGLDRALHTETPALADGTTLNPHQVDALSGTYAALLADAQRRTRGAGTSDGDALLLSFEDDEAPGRAEFLDEPPPQVAAPEDDEPEDDEPGDDADDADDAAPDDEFGSVPAAAEDDDEDDEDRPSLEDELEELPDAEPESESASYDDFEEEVDEDVDAAVLDDPNAHKRFWFEHATGAGKTVAAMGFVEACRTGGVLILTHRRNLVDQFIAELQTRGYGERLSKPLLGDADIDGTDGGPGHPVGPVTIETYQWFVRNAGQISGAYTVVICDEAHTALGEKTSATIRAWTGPIFIGMTATGALIARHVTDLFPTQTSRFDLAQAARRGVIAPLRCLRIPPGPGVRTIAKVPLRKGEVDMEFDQDELAKLLDQAPFNLAIADLYKTRFRNTPGVVYTAGVQHAYNVAESFRALDMKAEAVSGETPKRELARILADYEAGEIDVLVNAQLLAEGWNSPRATICMHLAPTASKRIYQQRVGRVTRRHPGKEAGVVIDFVHPATSNDDPVVTLHSLLDRDVYRGGAIVVGPVRRGRGRRVKVERRVLPVTPDIERRRDVFERELWRIAVEQLDWGEQRIWAALAGAKATPTNWRRGRAMLNFDRSGELRRQFLITALERNKNPQLRTRAIQEIAVLREADPFDTAIDFIAGWPREERREASRVLLQAMADRRIGRREQATAWIWRLAEYTRDLHEEYAAQRWPATKHLLGLLVNSSGAAHARNARRLVHAARQHDRRLQAALLAAAVAHTPEAEEVLRDARTRLARKPGALSRDLLKDFPSGKRHKKRSRSKKKNGEGPPAQNGLHQDAPDGPDVTGDGDREPVAVGVVGADVEPEAATFEGGGQTGGPDGGAGGGSRRGRSRRGRSRGGLRRGEQGGGDGQNGEGRAQGTPGGTAGGTAEDDASGRVGDGPSSTERTGTPVDADAPAEDEAPVRRRIRGQRAAALAVEADRGNADEVADGGGGGSGAPAGDGPAADAERDGGPEAPGDGRATNDGSGADAGEGEGGAPRSRRRRRRSGGEDAAETVAAADDALRPSQEDRTGADDAPARPSRRRRRAAAQAEAEANGSGGRADPGSGTRDAAQAGAGGPGTFEGAGSRDTQAAAEGSGTRDTPTEASGAPTTSPSPAGDARGAAAATSGAAPSVPTTGPVRRAPVRPAPARTGEPTLSATAAKAAPAVASAAPDAEHPAKARARAKAEAAANADDAEARGRATTADDDAPAETPGRRRPAKPAATAEDDVPVKASARRATKKAAAAGDDTPAKAPARRATKKTAAAEKPAARRTTAKPRATKPAATATDATGGAPAKRRRTTTTKADESE